MNPGPLAGRGFSMLIGDGCRQPPNSAPDGMHRAIGLNKVGRIDLMPGPLRRNTAQHRLCNLFIRSAGPQDAANVRFVQAEQAIAQATFGRQTKSIAAAAKWLAH